MILKKAADTPMWNYCLRRALGITQRTLAKDIGTSQFTISRYENFELSQAAFDKIHAPITLYLNSYYECLTDENRMVVAYKAALYYKEATGIMLLTPSSKDFVKPTTREKKTEKVKAGPKEIPTWKSNK